MIALKLRLSFCLHKASGPWLDLLKASCCFPRLFTAACFLTHNLKTSHSNTLFYWLNHQTGHLTLDNTVGLDLTIVSVSIQFQKEKLEPNKQIDSTLSSWTHHVSLYNDYKFKIGIISFHGLEKNEAQRDHVTLPVHSQEVRKQGFHPS